MKIKDLPAEFNLYPYLYGGEKVKDKELQKDIDELKRKRSAYVSNYFFKGNNQ